VLKGISLEIQAKAVVALVGASGAGKSTLLHLLGTLDEPDKGEVWFEDTCLTRLGEKQLSAFRNQSLGFVFQFHQLFPEFTALENVCIPAYIAGVSRANAEKQAKSWLERLGLSARANHKPSELSGGEQQRVAVARALINRPRIILADEPTGNLDSANSQELFRIMLELARAEGIGFLVATHNLELAGQADRILHIRDGKLPEDVA